MTFSKNMDSKEIDPSVQDVELSLPKDCHKLITPCRILFVGSSGNYTKSLINEGILYIIRRWTQKIGLTQSHTTLRDFNQE